MVIEITIVHDKVSDCSFRGRMPDSQFLVFDVIRNGMIEYFAHLNNNTDESDYSSTERSCDTHYSKCNRYWNCSNACDELIYRTIPSRRQVIVFEFDN